MGERRYYVYMMASRSRNLYTGMTSNIEARCVQHKTKVFAGFTADYNCNRFVWYESHDNPDRAIDREKRIKRWTRIKKLALINKINPTSVDLSEEWGNRSSFLLMGRKQCRSIRLAGELLVAPKSAAQRIGKARSG
jgi:putative endonuclease